MSVPHYIMYLLKDDNVVYECLHRAWFTKCDDTNIDNCLRDEMRFADNVDSEFKERTKKYGHPWPEEWDTIRVESCTHNLYVQFNKLTKKIERGEYR